MSALVEIASERQLALVAHALLGKTEVTAAERKLVVGGAASNSLVEASRELIKAGADPLGDAFLAIRSPETRRNSGAVYTPGRIVAAMVDWAASRGTPARVVDPGAGSGRFIAAAARAFPQAKLVACDIDPLATLLLKANATVLGFAERLEVQLKDYRLFRPSHVDGATLYIGNPPYVRHHKIPEPAKAWLAATAARLGLKASKLAGLHVHFFLRTREIATPGDWGAFVTSAEWLDVNYGSLVRAMLADGLGGSSLQVFPPDGMPFGNVMTTGVITTFFVGKRPDQFTVREIRSLGDLSDLEAGRALPWDEVKRHDRWSQMMRPPVAAPTGMVPLGDLFRVHRGAVTGGNDVFIAGAYSGKLPERFLLRAVTKALDLVSAGPRLTKAKAKKLRQLIVIPADLSDLSVVELKQVEAFKRWATKAGIPKTFTAKQRRAWWSVAVRDPAPVLCTYMARRAPTFTRNVAAVPHINIAHGLYPRVPMTAADLDAYTKFLSSNVCVTQGRTYAGGLTKFEPKEIEQILVPCLKRIHEQPGSVVSQANHGRRGAIERAVS